MRRCKLSRGKREANRIECGAFAFREALQNFRVKL